ncbi:arylamine N-acetyltransferase pineal gland isozyme NAT-3-like [Crotalus adamanteus]|uniref:arylamine N-acetyltransferase n=1 Tax=Crotalus adamanteus TaxID=8729 RepID=A0AAW1ASD7_CROAD
MGYKVSLLGAHVYDPERKAYKKDFTHLLIKVVLEGKTYIVDGGFGVAYQMWQPMELISEKNQPQTPGIFCFTEKKGVGYLHKLKRKKFRMDSENKILCSDPVKNMSCKTAFCACAVAIRRFRTCAEPSEHRRACADYWTLPYMRRDF